MWRGRFTNLATLVDVDAMVVPIFLANNVTVQEEHSWDDMLPTLVAHRGKVRGFPARTLLGALAGLATVEKRLALQKQKDVDTITYLSKAL